MLEISVKTKISEVALKYLNSITGSKSRKYEVSKMSKYLTSLNENFPIETAKFIAQIQTHMVETLKPNFSAFYKPNLICNSCFLSKCNQSHLLYCPKLIGSNRIIIYMFKDTDPNEQCFIAHTLMANLKKKKELESFR